MPFNEAERYLGELAERSFLKLWTVPNPFRKAGKELTDLLVAFGNDLVIFSDKACRFSGTMPLAWERWRRRTVDESAKKFKTTVRSIERSANIYLDKRASVRFPFSLPPASAQRLHLITIARPDHNPTQRPSNWRELTFDTLAASSPFKVGTSFVGKHLVHVFDSDAIEFLLTQLDTAPDLLQYLKSRETVIRQNKNISFAEKDLFATAVNAWANGGEFEVALPPPDSKGRVELPSGLWENYVALNGATLTKNRYANSKTIDLLINHFHDEYAAGRNLYSPQPTYDSHENAMRILASESRFSRRVIVDCLDDLLNEKNNKTFWAATVPSPSSPTVRYVWLTYPERPSDLSLPEGEQYILSHLRKHLMVARTVFGPQLLVGIAMPNRGVEMLSYFICILDGAGWSSGNEEEAQHWKAQGVFSNLDAIHRVYKR